MQQCNKTSVFLFRNSYRCVKHLIFRISILFTPSQALVNISCPTQGFPHSKFNLLNRWVGFPHTSPTKNQLKQGQVLILQLEKKMDQASFHFKPNKLIICTQKDYFMINIFCWHNLVLKLCIVWSVFSKTFQYTLGYGKPHSLFN